MKDPKLKSGMPVLKREKPGLEKSSLEVKKTGDSDLLSPVNGRKVSGRPPIGKVYEQSYHDGPSYHRVHG